MTATASFQILHPFSIRKLCMTEKYLVVSTVAGLTTILDIRCQHNGSEACEHRRAMEVGKAWDLDCCDDMIATANEDGIVRVWDIRLSSEHLNLVGHTDCLNAILFPNSSTIISGSRDTTIIVWDVPSGGPRHTLTGHTNSIICLKLHDNLLASGSHNGAVRIWDMNNGQCVHILEGHSSFVSILGFNDNHALLATGAPGGDTKIWNVGNGACLAACQGHVKVATQFSNLPGNLLVSSAADGTIRTWDWASGTLIRTLLAHDRAVRGFAWTKDYMISGGMDGRLRAWDRETHEFRFDLRDRVSAIWSLVSRENIVAVALRIEKGNHLIELWDTSALCC